MKCFMSSISDESQPQWVEPHMRDLAKIHDSFYEGSRKIQNFVKEHNLGIADFERYKVETGSERDRFHEMITDEDVKEYLVNVGMLLRLREAIEFECRRQRSVEQRFDEKVLQMESIENPPPELFQIRDGKFPISRTAVKSLGWICRTLRNTADHIPNTFTEYNRSHQEKSWENFIKELVPMSIQDFIELFIMGFQALEYIADGTTDLITPKYVETQLRAYTDNALLMIKPEIMKSALGANKWDKYIEVEHMDTNQADDEPMAIGRLDFLLRKNSPHSYVEINGWGGLGKTKLAREYISRSIDGDLRHRPKGYEYYIYYTAKSTNQGEIAGEHNKPLKNSPRDWAKGGGDYVPGLSFDGFIAKIQKTFQLPIHHIEDVIIEHLAKHEIFLLLDNFEDVSDADIPKYRAFFDKIPKDFNSRIVITSRRTPTYGAKSITLDRFNKKKAMQMLYTRYQHEIENNNGEERTNLLHQLRDSYTENTGNDEKGPADLIDIILREVEKGEGKSLETLSENLRHPLYLRYLANLLVNPTLIEQTKGLTKVSDVLVHIIDDPQFRFWEWHENVVKWMLDHAYSNIKENQHTLTVLKILLNSEGAIQLSSLRSKFQKEHPELDNPIYVLTSSIDRIKSHREFFDEKIAEGEYALTSSARKYLLGIQPRSAANSTVYEQDTDVTGRNNIDFQTTLQRWLKDGQPNYVGFRDGLYRLKGYITTLENYKLELFDEVEEKLLTLVDNLAYDTIEMEDLLDLLELRGLDRNKESRFNLLCKKAEVYTRRAGFETLGDQIHSLTKILLGNKIWPTFSSDGPKEPHRGHVLILLLKIRKHGIQTDVEPLIFAIADLLEKMHIDEIEFSVQDYDYRDTFAEILLSDRRALRWTIKLQQVFEIFHKTQSSDSFTDKFSSIEPGMIRDDIRLFYHPDGGDNFDNYESIYTVNWDLMSNQLTIYVQEKPPNLAAVAQPRLVGISVSQTKPNLSRAMISGSAKKRIRDLPLNPFAKNDPFEQWTTGTRKGKPGLSIDPVSLASDIFMVCELYNQVTLKGKYSTRGENLKSRYKELYRGSSTSHSAAWIIGFHSKQNKTLSHKMAHDFLLKEFKRRLGLSEHKDESTWETTFALILTNAVMMLNQGLMSEIDEDVRSEIETRKSLHDVYGIDLFDPRRRAIVDGGKAKAGDEHRIVNREECILPNAVQNSLKDAENIPWIDAFTFRKQMLRGGLAQLIEADKILEDNFIKLKTNAAPWSIHTSWLDSVVEFFFTGERYPQFFKKYSLSEKLISDIEDYHYQKWFLN